MICRREKHTRSESGEHAPARNYTPTVVTPIVAQHGVARSAISFVPNGHVHAPRAQGTRGHCYK